MRHLPEMTPCVNGLRREHGQIRWLVILLILVDVMHDFFWRQGSSEKRLGDDAMLVARAFLRVCGSFRDAPLVITLPRAKLLDSFSNVLFAESSVERRIAPRAEER